MWKDEHNNNLASILSAMSAATMRRKDTIYVRARNYFLTTSALMRLLSCFLASVSRRCERQLDLIHAMAASHQTIENPPDKEPELINTFHVCQTIGPTRVRFHCWESLHSQIDKLIVVSRFSSIRYLCYLPSAWLFSILKRSWSDAFALNL